MITNGVGKKFREEVLLGIHTLSEGAPDTIKAALYGADADIGPDDDAYTASGEIAATGAYSTGGVAVPLTIVGASGSSRNAGTQFSIPYAQPTDDLDINPLTGVGVRGLMLYNASQSNRNILTLDFGESVTPNVGLKIRWGLSNVVNLGQVLIPLVDGAI